MPRQYSTTPYTERFFKYIGRKTETGCIPWTGAVTRGYGVLGRGRAGEGNIYATRVAYEIAYGPFSTDLNVCHHCDNPLCVNPSHLFLGTQAENLADMRKKERHNRGEKNGNAVLVSEQILAIRAAIASGESQRSIAERFGTTQPNISLIATGRNWRHA